MKYTNIDRVKSALFSLAGAMPDKLFHTWRGNALMLLYHRIVPDDEVAPEFNPNSYSEVTCSLFEEHIIELAARFHVVSIDHLYQHILKKSKDFVVSITFDDGYKDNLIYALPILERHNVPATFYITTRFPEGDTWMWWYEFWDYILTVDYVVVEFESRVQKWRTDNIKNKLQCYYDLKKVIIGLGYNEQKSFAEIVTQNATRKQYDNLCLKWDEIKSLGAHSLATIGAHTHTHSALSMLSEEEAYSEMAQSKKLLEKKLGYSVNSIAYPYGREKEAAQREFNLAKKCGFQTGVTTYPDPLIDPQLHAIPRLGVPFFVNKRVLRTKLSGCENFVRKLVTLGKNRKKL
jgi:peptidoglycan/xylan/chitin deacetylase (PgdA/CDA1 family)